MSLTLASLRRWAVLAALNVGLLLPAARVQAEDAAVAAEFFGVPAAGVAVGSFEGTPPSAEVRKDGTEPALGPDQRINQRLRRKHTHGVDHRVERGHHPSHPNLQGVEGTLRGAGFEDDEVAYRERKDARKSPGNQHV